MLNKQLRSRMYSIKISPHVKDGGLAEIYQTMKTKMAILRRDGENEFTRITPLVLCRDFLTDVYTFSKAKVKFEIYGCAFDPSLEVVQQDGCYLLMMFPTNEAQAHFEKNLAHLWEIEGANDLEPTQYIPNPEKAKECVIIGDPEWIRSCLLFSLYSSLLRNFCYDLPEEGWIPAMRAMDLDKNTDARLVNSVDDEIWGRVCSDLALLKTKEFCGFEPGKAHVSEIHHNSGFYSVFGTHGELSIQTVKKNTHWKDFKELGWPLHTK